jgi:multidrug efflux pump subunit AcrA (membrane-fusion protein)
VRKRGLVVGGGLLALTAIGLGVGLIRTKYWRKSAVPAKPAAVVSTTFQGSEITLTGRLQPQKTEQVDAPVSGILDQWFVEEGQEVYADQLVGRIRNADLDNTLQQAQSAVDRAEVRVAQLDAEAVNSRLEVSRTTADQIRARNELDRIEKLYQRYKNLMDAGALARLTFEKTEAEYIGAKTEAENRDRSAKEAQDKALGIQRDSDEAKRALVEQTAALAKAKEAVAEGDLHSPADGAVLTRRVHQGDQVEESAEGLLTIATALTKLAVSLTPDPAVLARIHAGQQAFVRVDDKEFPGAVKEVRGAEVIVEFTSAEPVTKLGTAAQVRIVF